jgi:hypothetical protein
VAGARFGFAAAGFAFAAAAFGFTAAGFGFAAAAFGFTAAGFAFAAAAFGFAPAGFAFAALARFGFAPPAAAAFAPAALGAENVFGCAGSSAPFVPAAPGPLAPPPRRLSLRCPGRDLGRLPSTPGSSLLLAAIPQK